MAIENAVVAAPMPSASIMTATEVNPHDFTRPRALNRMSWSRVCTVDSCGGIAAVIERLRALTGT